jgi:hypothetical protein
VRAKIGRWTESIGQNIVAGLIVLLISACVAWLKHWPWTSTLLVCGATIVILVLVVLVYRYLDLHTPRALAGVCLVVLGIGAAIIVLQPGGPLSGGGNASPTAAGPAASSLNGNVSPSNSATGSPPSRAPSSHTPAPPNLSLLGSWSGDVTADNHSQPQKYPIKLDITYIGQDKIVGTATYPRQGCERSLTFVERPSEQVIHLRERLTSQGRVSDPAHDCLEEVYVVLQLLENEEISLLYYEIGFNGTPFSHALLRHD